MKKGKDGRYTKTVTINGKRYYIKGRSQAEINRKYDTLLEEKHKGTLFIDGSVTLEEYLGRFMEIKKPNISHNTYQMYHYAALKLEPIKDYPLSKITHTDLQMLLNSLSDTPNQQRKVKILLHQLFKMAVSDKAIIYNPAESLTVTPYQKHDRRALNVAERQALLSAELSPSDRLFVDLLYYCGLRKGEALALRRSDIDFRNATLNITKNLDLKAHAVKPPKTKTSIRTVPIPLPLLKELKDCPMIDYFFLNANGELHTVNSYRRMWDRIMKAADIDITAHYLRHNYCTMLAENGIDMKVAQRYLGHADITTTMNIYAHVTDEKERMERQKVMNMF